MNCDKVLSYLHFPEPNSGERVITGFWALPRPHGSYRWRFPPTLLDRLGCLLDLKNSYILHLFCGGSTFGDVRIDINPAVNPTHVLDLTKDRIPYPDETFDIVIADPPYYDFPPYSFVKEAVRVLKTGGYLVILHQLIYIKPRKCDRFAVIGVSRGPNMRMSALQIFRKVG